MRQRAICTHRRAVHELSPTADEEQARALVAHSKLSVTPEALVEEMLAHTGPGVLVVAMVSAIALLQSEGQSSYIKV